MFQTVLRLALIASLLFVVAHCRAPLRGTDFGRESDAYLYADHVEPEKWSDAPLYRLVLFGDGGRPSPDDPTLELLGRWGDEHPEKTTVVYLGDNLYPAGLQDSDRARGEAVLMQQIEATRADKILIPGNHDWGFTGADNLTAGVLANQQEFVDSKADLGARFLPRDGCPGPEPVELVPADASLAGGLVLVVLDLHWWLLDQDERLVCKGIDGTSAFIERLREVLTAAHDRNVVVVAHHPVLSSGPHGGFTRGFWMDLGVAIFYRFYTVQDTIEPHYREMVAVLSEVLSENPPLAMVGGHDHSLQVMKGGDIARLILVSGAGSGVTGVTSLDETLFAHAHRGFIVLDFHAVEREREADLAVHVVETGTDEPVFSLGVDLARKQAPPEPVMVPDAAPAQ